MCVSRVCCEVRVYILHTVTKLFQFFVSGADNIVVAEDYFVRREGVLKYTLQKGFR